MAINLFGDPYNLQGNSGSSLQGGFNPQQAANPYGPTPAPTARTVAPVAPARSVKPRIAAPTRTTPTAQPKQLNSIFEPYIGTRPSPYNPGVLEYFRKDTNQGLSQQDLFNYASQLGAGGINSFDQLHAPVGAFHQQVQNYQPAIDPNSTLAQNAGTAGLSPDEYTKIIQQQNQLTPEEIAQIRGGLGIDQLEKTVFTPPSQTTQQLYSDAYNSAGLADVKQKILDLNKLVNDKRQQFVDAQGNVNENPFLSESSRVGRISRLQDKAQLEINNILDQQKQYQDLYQQGLNEVNGLVTRHTNDFTTEQTLNTQKLQYLLSKAEQQAAAQLAQKNQAAYKYLPDYLKAKAKATAPTTFSAGNGASFYFDKATGTFQQLTQPQGQYELATNPLTGEQAPFNKQTGQLGAGGTFSGYAAGTAPRLSNNNNPTAFTTDVAKDMGLIEGVDYVRGDKFPGSSNLYTAKLLNDPIATTIKGIDQGGFYTKSGKPRWSYLGELPQDAIKNWGSLSYDQKAAVIQQMFIREGGKGQLMTQGTQSNPVIDNLVEQVRSNPALLANLPETYQKAVIAKLAQSNSAVPSSKQTTDTQNQAATYATRVQQAGSVLDNLTSNIASYNPIGFEAELKLPSYLQSSQIQQYMQAARNLVNAILRRESGAAISSGEFENAYAQYLPKPGDSTATVAQKKQNRDAILQGLIRSSGPATPSGPNAGNTTSGGSSNDPLGLGI